MSERKMSKERVEEMESVFSKLKTFEFVPVSVGSIKDLLHDLELERAENERLREANEKLMVELELQVKKYIWATCGVPKPQAVQEQE